MADRRHWWWLGAVLLLGSVGMAVVMADGGGVAASSALTRGPSGWLGLRATLDEWGVATVLRDRPLDAIDDGEGDVTADVSADDEDNVAPADVAAGSPTLVVAFPLQRAVQSAEIEAVAARLRAGGTVVVAYGGKPIDLREMTLLEALGVSRSGPTNPSIVPWTWARERRAVWHLRPEGVVTEATLTDTARVVEIAAPRAWPLAPEEATVLYRGGPDNVAAVFSLPVQRGRVVVVPADAWSNARLGNPGNADLLATWAGSLGSTWELDEYHHGLSDPVLAAERRATAVVVDLGFVRLTYWDLLALHLILLYLLGLAALGRRFGPAWREPPLVSGSTGAFLRGLGTLHDRLGHHADVAQRLADRLGDGATVVNAGERAAMVTHGAGLVAFGQDIHADLIRRPSKNQPDREE